MGIIAGGIAFVIVQLFGCSAAYIGGRFESLAMRIIDLQLSFPAILLAFVMPPWLGQGRYQLILALIFAQYALFRPHRPWSGCCRTPEGLCRGRLIHSPSAFPLARRSQTYPAKCAAAADRRCNGAGSKRNLALEATLSFLGVGLPPTEPSLGMLIANGFQYLLSGRYWISIYPDCSVIIFIVSLNLSG